MEGVPRWPRMDTFKLFVGLRLPQWCSSTVFLNVPRRLPFAHFSTFLLRCSCFYPVFLLTGRSDSEGALGGLAGHGNDALYRACELAPLGAEGPMTPPARSWRRCG